jgi:phosphatidylglycerophosphatase A
VVGVVLYLVIAGWSPSAQLAAVAVIAVVGIRAASVAARHFGRDDPSHVVIDEVAGQILALALTGATVSGCAMGFLLFRAFDVIKPWPCGPLERLHGGLGIMADDLMAGLYANVALQLLLHLLPGSF